MRRIRYAAKPEDGGLMLHLTWGVEQKEKGGELVKVEQLAFACFCFGESADLSKIDFWTHLT